MHLANCVDEVSEQRGICRAFDKAPHVPVAGTSTVSMSNGNLQVDLVFPANLIALRAMQISPQYSLIAPARPKNAQEGWAALSGTRIGVFGQPQRIQMDEGGEWKNGVRAALGWERRLMLQFQGAGAHARILERRNGLARCI